MADLAAFAVAFGLVFLAELGDKTQLVIVGLASKGRPVRVVAGAAAAFLVLTALAVAVGEALGRWVPGTVVALVGGALFLLFGVLVLRGRDEEAGPVRRTGLLPAFGLVLVAELGDKTQLATAALAARSGAPVETGLGAFLALMGSTLAAALLGGWLARKVRPAVLRGAAGILFLAMGALFLLGAFVPLPG